MSQRNLSRRGFLRLSGLTTAGVALAACVAQSPQDAAEAGEAPAANTTLTFAWWGSPYEKETGEEMLASFTEETGIPTEPMHIAQQYMDKMQAMAAAGTLPDVFYLYYTYLVAWAEKGIIAELTSLYESDPEAEIEQIVEVNRFKVGNRIYGTGACTEPYMMFYNKAIFDDMGVAYPPATVEEAWDWDQFLEVAQQLTVDENGAHPGEAGFDPENIKTFGVDVIRWGGSWRVYTPGLWQQGGTVYSEDLNSIFPDIDMAADVIQRTADTYVKWNVAPSPEFMGQMGMNAIQMMETGRMAMFLSGNWSLEELSHSGIDYGEAVVPKMGDDYAIWAPSEAIGMSSKTEDVDAAWELYKWVVFGEGSLALSRTGLWQPQRVDLLTTEEGRAVWMSEGVHTPEHVTAACLPAVHNAHVLPARLGQAEWESKYLGPALEPVYRGEVTAADALAEVVPKINEFLEENPTWMPS